MKKVKFLFIVSYILAIAAVFTAKSAEIPLSLHPGFIQSGTACTPTETECGGTGPIVCNLTVYYMQNPNDNTKCQILLTKRDP
jgi:hypothetical protein